jgi:hypothetical protein
VGCSSRSGFDALLVTREADQRPRLRNIVSLGAILAFVETGQESAVITARRADPPTPASCNQFAGQSLPPLKAPVNQVTQALKKRRYELNRRPQQAAILDPTAGEGSHARQK